MEEQSRKEGRVESFARGALIITLAVLFSRLLGALYRPIVVRLFAPFDGQHGEAGFGLTQVPAPAYLVVLSVSAFGINIAISRLVADRMARGRYRSAWRVFRLSLVLMSALGLVLGAAFYAAAPLLATVAGRPETTPGFQAIAPAIFLVSVMAAYRGLFQGLQRMGPYAASQVYEQIVRIVAGIALVWLLAPRSVPLAAAGYNFGATAGALTGLVYLVLVFWRQRRELLPALFDPARADGGGQAAPGPEEAAWPVLREILRLAAPISIIGAVQPLILMTDSLLVITRLEAAGVSAQSADALLGQLANSFSIVWLPAILTAGLYTSLVPAITESLARRNWSEARSRSVTAYRLTLLFSLPATAGIWVLADGIYKLFFLSEGGPVLRALAPATFFMMLQQTSSGVLQGAGDIATPVRNFLLGAGLKVVLTFWWTATGLGARGAAYATGAAFALAGGLNVLAVRRRFGALTRGPGDWLRPAAATLVMSAFAAVAERPLAALLGSPRLGTVAVVVLAAGVYGAALLGVRGIRARDLRMLPGPGPRLAGLLVRWRLLPPEGGTETESGGGTAR